MRDYRLYLKDISDAMDSIEKFVEGMDFDEFIRDDKTTSAVVRKFEIIGEATKMIPEFIKEKYPQVPWKDMAGMRDRLIHAYFGIDYVLIWETIKNAIPKTKSIVHKILEESREKKWK